MRFKKHIEITLIIIIFFTIMANCWSMILFSQEHSFLELLKISNPIYQIVIFSSFILSIVRRNIVFYFSFFCFSLYILLSLPSLGIDSFNMIYFSLITKNIQAFIFVLTAWLMPFISFILFILKYIEYKDEKQK